MRTLKGPVLLATLTCLASTSVPARHTDAQTPGVVVYQPNQSVYTYPNGRYELRGEGTGTSPYYWVWIPTGAQSMPTPPPPPSNIQASQRLYTPPPLPAVQANQRVYAYPEGRYELLGDGTARSPYYWVWIPAGVQSVPSPPPYPNNVQPGQAAYTYPDGRYELRGEGTTTSPYYWVWIPASTVSQPPAVPYGFRSELKSTEGEIDEVGLWGTSITLSNGEKFEIPDSSALATQPTVGKEVIVTYYVTQDGRNIVRSLDPNSAK